MATDITKALTSLMRNRRLSIFGNTLSRLKLVIDNNYPSMAAVNSDGCLVFNPTHEWALNCTDLQLQHVLIHEASHILLNHLQRIDSKLAADPHEMRIYNIAADMALEYLLRNVSTYSIPEHINGLTSILPSNDWDKSMEKLVPLVRNALGSQPNPPKSVPSSAGGQMEQLTPKGAKAVKDAVSKAVSGVKTQSLDGQASDLVAKILRNYMPISDVALRPLKKYFQVIYGSKESTKAPSTLSQRNLLRRNFMGLPMLGRAGGASATHLKNKEEWHNDLTILVDVSGSVSRKDVMAAMRFIQRLCVQHNVYPVRVQTFNHQLVQNIVVDNPSVLDGIVPDLQLGGGTSICKALLESKITSKLTLVFTDMEDCIVTKKDYDIPDNQVVFLAYGYDKGAETSFSKFTAGEWLDANLMVSAFKE